MHGLEVAAWSYAMWLDIVARAHENSGYNDDGNCEGGGWLRSYLSQHLFTYPFLFCDSCAQL